MEKITLKFLLFFCSSLFLLGCQRDDICPESTETTQDLTIEFLDSEDPTKSKAARNLVVIADGMEDTLLGPTNTNSIEIPLRTDQNSTTYHFILNSDSETENTDSMTFSYSPSTEYLSRACGFRVSFTNLQVSRHQDEDTWIISHSINIEDETDISISITH